MKNFFETYSSDTLAGSSVQSLFFPEDPNEKRTSMLFYKVFYGGEHNYSFLFSNTVDGTFEDGSVSRSNDKGGDWKFISLKAGVCRNMKDADKIDFKTVTFSGDISKNVCPGELFFTDAVSLSPKKGDYIVLRLEYSGDRLPCHPEAIYPVWNLTPDGWEERALSPIPSMIGCDLKTECKIAFIGDSITQGLGTDMDSYEHWNSVYADLLGEGYSYWNLGIGYGRASDAATGGVWLQKALKNDIVFVCFGVNDINRMHTAQQIINDIDTIVNTLLCNGKKVVLQTVPPFNYDEEKQTVWNEVNSHIRKIHNNKKIMIFDNVKVLGESSDSPYKAKYGGHPNKEGCKVWAQELYKATKEFVKEGK